MPQILNSNGSWGNDTIHPVSARHRGENGGTFLGFHGAPYYDKDLHDKLQHVADDYRYLPNRITEVDSRMLDYMKDYSFIFQSEVNKGGRLYRQEKTIAESNIAAAMWQEAALSAIILRPTLEAELTKHMAKMDAKAVTAEAVQGTGKTMPQDFLDDALNQQGLTKAPAGLKQVWTENGYKYEVKVHGGESQYTNADSIYRVSRQAIPSLDSTVQGTGTEYLGTDGNWYHTSVLREFYSAGQPNPAYDANAAQITHIPLK